MNSETRTATDVLIVGAGPTGLTLACDLARRGVKFRIIDKVATYFVGSRGKGLQPRSLEVFDDLGIIEKILAHGRFHLPFRGYDGATVLGDRDLNEGRHATPNVPYASSLIIPQWRVEEILRDKLSQSGSYVELATELVNIEQDELSVTATLSHENTTEQVRTRYLVAADGGKSFVRKHFNIDFEGETWKDERMLVGDVQVDVLDRDHWHSWPKHEGGWVALCPLPSTNTFQFQAQIPPDEPDEPSLERFQQIIDERTGRPDIKLHDATWLSLYRANIRMVDRYRVGGVFLAGDAAHVHSPAGGQGMNTGIQDAYNLGWKLGAVLSTEPATLLDTYEEERLPIAAWLLGVTTKLHRQILQGTANTQRDPELLQLGLNYRGSSLTEDAANPSTTLQAGDRAPDAPLVDLEGKTVRLFDTFRGPKFTLLSFGSDNATAIAELSRRYESILNAYQIIRPNTSDSRTINKLIDEQGHAFSAYGIESDATFLIRPDGYIGFIGRGEPSTSIDNYIKRIG